MLPVNAVCLARRVTAERDHCGTHLAKPRQFSPRPAQARKTIHSSNRRGNSLRAARRARQVKAVPEFVRIRQRCRCPAGYRRGSAERLCARGRRQRQYSRANKQAHGEYVGVSMARQTAGGRESHWITTVLTAHASDRSGLAPVAAGVRHICTCTWSPGRNRGWTVHPTAVQPSSKDRGNRNRALSLPL
jgi:hypothetical protein